MNGILISLDGVDGGGKSTQAKLLGQWYEQQGRETLSIRDPGGTQLGEALRDILLHRQEIPLCMVSEMLIYMASRAQLVVEVIRPALAVGKVVICDRFLLANVVYQGSAGGIEIESIWNVGNIATGGLEPDMTIIMDLDVDVALSRIDGGLDRLESRGAPFMMKVREGFLHESKRLGAKAIVIDASQEVQAIHQQIISAVRVAGVC